MAVFLADVSSYQHGLRVAALADCVGVLAKCSEGTYYTDVDYDGWRREAAVAGKLFVAYHFMRADESAEAQATWIGSRIGDTSLPLELDVETEGSSKPTFAQVIALAKACKARGLRVKLLYLPRWYWQQIGSPNMSELNTLGIGLISSSYPGGSGTAAKLYPGDNSAGWSPYGGVTPLLYQFTDQATDGGLKLDMNAYRGSREQLAAFLNVPSPVPQPTHPPVPALEDDMPTFANGQVAPGFAFDGDATDPNHVQVIPVPPPNGGAAKWGNVWFSLGTDFGDVTVRVAWFVNGNWIIKDNVVVSAAGPRVNPMGGPLPAGTEKISIGRRKASPTDTSDHIPLGYLIETAAR